MLKGSLIIGQSGGPSSVINASAYGVIRTALDADCITKVYGAYHGIKGVLDDQLLCMDEEDRAELDRLPYTPSSALGSCRYKIKDPDEDDTDYKRILEIFKKYDVRYFCYNDLFGTDHCPGYASAAKYIATSVMEVSRDAHVYDTGMITIIECMGRHAGWLTAAAALANEEEPCCDFIYLPEVNFDMDKFVADVSKRYEEKKNCIVAVSEGVHYADGSFVSEAKTAATDGFGHAQLGGLAATLANIMKERTGAKVRGIELSLLQRCAAHCASGTDIEEAFMSGKTAVEQMIAGVTDKMVGFECDRTNGYTCKAKLFDLSDVANFEKKFPAEWITPEGNNVTEDFVKYAMPLIQGETKLEKVDGLPRFARLKKVFAK